MVDFYPARVPFLLVFVAQLSALIEY